MKLNKFIAVLAVLVLCTSALFAANKDMVQLQTQVQAIQDQLTQMKQSIDERMGVMRNLVEQSTDTVNKLNGTMADLQKAIQQQHTDTGTRADQLSGQIQALNDSVDELKARLNKMGQQLDAMQAAAQNLNTPPTGTPGATGMPGPGGAPQAQAPPPDVLYNNALRDYNSANYQLAQQEFGDYMKYYPSTDLAGNAQYYLADILYRQGDYQGAVKAYDQVLEMYPGGNKTQAAQLKKGYALLELGQRSAGVKELNSLIQRYPRSLEAQQARERLRKMGATASAKPSAARE
ncbi:MAG TPA: tetratricopeptide repeat protein [Terriglobales bacterium]|nr:tetratricopeptide repeat protein [Terriglobales bacterium]